ncbi:MAG TPA: hypothetical protein DCM14_09615 [Clostridiales bacterium UBA8153]|nr:hypothetical protein [Clostridiales bacterium UBA8153]
MGQEERVQILRMVQEGKISAEEAARLLQAVEQVPKGERAPGKGAARWLRIQVTDTRTGYRKVNINLPAGLVTWALRFIPDVGSEEKASLLDVIRQGGYGKIIEVTDDDDHEKVEISIE